MNLRKYWPSLLACLALVALSSCTMSRHAAERKIRRIDRACPQAVALACASLYKIADSGVGRTRYIQGPLVEVPGPVIQIPCPDSAGHIVYIPVRCPPSHTQHDTVYKDSTIYRENTARVTYLQYQVDSLRQAISRQTEKVERITRGRDWWRKYCLITWGLLALIGAGWWLKPKIGL